MSDQLDLGVLLEGQLEQDPMTDEYSIRTLKDGKFESIPLKPFLDRYLGREVRLTFISQEAIAEIESLLEGQDVPVQGIGFDEACSLLKR